MLSDAKFVEICQSDAYASPEHIRISLSITFGKFMGILFGLKGVKETGVLCQWRGGHAGDPLRVPSSRTDKTDDGTCSDDVTTGYPDQVLVGADGSAKPNSILPCSVQFCPHTFGHKPEHLLPTLYEALMCFFSCKRPYAVWPSGPI